MLKSLRAESQIKTLGNTVNTQSEDLSPKT